jgi:signal transduction histidine kinase
MIARKPSRLPCGVASSTSTRMLLAEAARAFFQDPVPEVTLLSSHNHWWPWVMLAVATVCVVAVVRCCNSRAHSHSEALRLQADCDAQVAERTRIAREVHDKLLQGFTGITLQLQAVRVSLEDASPETGAALDDILNTADTSLREARIRVEARLPLTSKTQETR